MNIEEPLETSTNSPFAKVAFVLVYTIIAVLALTNNSLVVFYVRYVI